MSKNYIIFSAQYLPTMGGVERYVYGVATELLKLEEDCKIYIITSSLEGLPSKEDDGDITVLRLPTIQLMNGRMPVVKYNKTTRKILKEIFSNNIDLVILSTRLYPLSLVGSIFARKAKVPSISIEHGQKHLEIGGKIVTVFSHIYEHILFSLIKTGTKNFASVSKAGNVWLKHFKVSTDIVLYNSADFNAIDNIPSLPTVKNQAVYNGRIIKEKGIIQLIKAFNEMPQYNLVVVGDGNLLPQAKKIAKSNIVFMGRQPYDKTMQILKQSSLFCLTSDYEGFATSSLEAAYCKVPILITDVSGARELITSPKYGTIIGSNSVEDIKNGVIQTMGKITDENLEELKQHVIDNFTFKRTAEKIKDLELLC